MEVYRKKKVAFVLEGATVGGIETVLTQMLRRIDTDRYEITLFTNIQGNPCIGKIPECIKVVDLADFDLRSNFLSSIRKVELFRAAKLLFSYLKLRFCNSEFEAVSILSVGRDRGCVRRFQRWTFCEVLT